MYKGINKPYYDKLTIVYVELPLFTKKERELKTDIEQWVYALKYLPKLNSMPAALRNEIFEKLFELARIAKMNKRQQNAYYKSLHDMGIVKNMIAIKENTIKEQGIIIKTLQQENTSLQQGYTSLHQGYTSLQQSNDTKDKRIAELERQLALKN